MKTIQRLVISLLVLLGCTTGAWAIEQDSEGYYLIGSVQDWKDFAELIKTTPTANARMTADIDLGSSQAMLGDSEHEDRPTYYYQGTFDGQGYTLTVHYTGTSQTAPFAMISKATIKNIHVDGTIANSSGSQPSVVARAVYGKSTLDNIWSSVVITDTRTGWDETACLVGCVDGYKSGSVDIRNCLFTGTINSSGSYNGCFVGYVNSGGSATITNCLSVGTFNYTGGSAAFRGSHTNCYVSSFPASFPSGVTETTDESLADGTIAEALGDAWVQDPLTNKPLPKIFTTIQDEDGYYLIGSVADWKRFAAIVETTPTANAKMIKDVDLGDDQTMIGTSTMKYQGTFDGQAHTLTVNYSGSSEQFVAPFHYVDGGTIINLRIDGIVSSSNVHLSGLIGKAYNEVTIENCLVAAEIKMYSDYAGGFVGNGGSQRFDDSSKVVFKNCLFAGTFTGVGGSRNNAAGFYGWGASTPVFINCLENGTFNNVSDYNPFMYEGTDRDNTETTANSYYKHGSINLEGISDASAMTDGEIVSNLGDAWVQDAILNMPMLKIFASPKEEYFLIGSIQDWKDFAALVETTPNVNGKLTADVDLGDDQTMIGSIASPYQGLFDGQGYTLTVNYDIYSSYEMGAVAPFACVKNATIKNLHVAGSIKQQFCGAGGVVGAIMGDLTVSSCWVSAYMYVQGYGNYQGTIGGIASYCDNSNARDCSILIEDCVFSGEMATGYHCGSIMSHVNGDYGNSVTIKNCLSIGTYASAIGSTGTFIRTGVQGDPYTIENCYYKTSWGAVQGTQATETQLADGTTAASLGNAWMQDPNTNLPLPKIFVKPNVGVLNGIFTINSAGDKVAFAQGNLQKTGTMYQFAENQYDYFGTNQSNTHRDMFAFLDYSNPEDDNSWFMLSRDEWEYLFVTRSVTNTLSADARFTMATIGDTYKGLIIFPDYYEHPEGTGFIAGVFNSNSNYTAQVSIEGWAMMEAAGCVFLPAAGYCSHGETWKGVGEHVCYMSTTAAGSGYYTPWITPEGVYLGSESISVNSTWSSIRLALRLHSTTYTVPSSGVGTFSSNVNIQLPEGLSAHYCKTYYAERSAISVVNISGNVVPANTGVLLSGTPGETFTLTETYGEGPTITNNELVAVTESKHINAVDGDYTNFMMKGGKFIKIQQDGENVKMPANRAYLPLLTAAINGSNAKEITLLWDESEATGIEIMRNVENEIMKNENIYNLNGQKLSAPRKGINIINGRKVIVK